MARSNKRKSEVEEPTTAPDKKKSRSKHNVKTAAEPVPEPAAKLNRSKKAIAATASSIRPNRTTLGAPQVSRSTRSSSNGTPVKGLSKAVNKSKSSRTTLAASQLPRSTRSSSNGTPVKGLSKAANKSKGSAKSDTLTKSTKTAKSPAARGKKATKSTTAATDDEEAPAAVSKGRHQANISVKLSAKEGHAVEADSDDEAEDDNDGPSYWLMKAEPDSRIEKGKDVKFSIDDLKAASTPEGWDGVRNPSARNNLRAMIKGDMAFFYHSNCKVPGIVGTMEIVQEHSVDETAFDPEHSYYDEKSTRKTPKWEVVHVEFRQKFPEIIKLKDLQKYAKPGGVLEKLQTLRQSRLSVSKVTKKEWDFIMGLVDIDDVATASAQHEPQMVG